jgi:hypothetical protein
MKTCRNPNPNSSLAATQWYSDRHTLFKHSPAYLNQSADESSMITSVVKLTNLPEKKIPHFFSSKKRLISATPEMRRNAKKISSFRFFIPGWCQFKPQLFGKSIFAGLLYNAKASK